MTQTRDILPLRLQLTPMQVSEIIPVPTKPGDDRRYSPLAALNGKEERLGGCQVTLYPGEGSELLIQLENRGDRNLQFNIRIEGDFPSQWYRLNMEGREVPPRREINAVVYFEIPPDFFESDEVGKYSRPLQLDYQGKISILYSEADTGRQLNESSIFYLHIRSRSLYPKFLPEIYGEVDFIGRFLKIFEETFEPTVQALDAMWAYLDPLMTAEALLPFLAHWVGWNLNPALGLNRQRYLIRQAMEIYRWRGTRRGLRFYLHLFTDLPLDEDLPEAEKHISIREMFTEGFVMGNTQLGANSFVGGGQPYHFTVVLRTDNMVRIDEMLVREIIEQEKPAFCTYQLQII
ncbi:MAG TPA: phage tail protein [Cyanobacteria bacterium UBA11149]|nr:phage tail protein [Cyanobacteria bacterium UBA11366]HBK63071.1 phage tail protein [Cyanobacteria bacterium UBA11166]HBR77055.1 phage tail protein [Cyanobacteria bacterium UBA11159]HBS71998.1 phage tail protein [Cyanobacteria bacterium UBA11153]HBW92474.1 phage tail protein [Cyanobacteria bacterium UBA11149]HCA96425.1 phage tail protein [Cyanobacteria bacterium UBA9226]